MADRGLLDLAIARIPGAKPAEKIRLCGRFNGEEELFALSRRDIEVILQRGLDKELWTMEEIKAQAEQDAERARIRRIGFVSYAEEHYPPLLREIYDPPVVLFYRGALPEAGKPLAAVVGTRRPSGRSAAQAYSLGRDLAKGGIPVVSGLALGIDAQAHRGNLEGGAPTVAVLGCGPDGVYPVSNRNLARRILENGGVILSEYPPETPVRKWHFPARNRIISGLARGTVIVEAPAASGALITARFALEQNRDLWVTRAGVDSPLGQGCRDLAGEGAPVISGAEDILRDWGMLKQCDKVPLVR